MTTADVRVRIGVGVPVQAAPPQPRAQPPCPLAGPLQGRIESLDPNNDRTLFAVYCFIKNFIG